MSFRHDMSNEKAPKKKILLPEGMHHFKILSVKQATSKSGNEMFIFTIKHMETGYEEDIYAVATEGKRYFLKQILHACGIDEVCGVYDWDETNVVNKDIFGIVGHEPNEYINRSGETVKTMQHKIVDVKPFAWGS